MIIINIKILIVTVLVLFSFTNNLLLGFDNLKKINQHLDIECFLIEINPNIKQEKPFFQKIKILYRYLFFYNIEEPTSIIEVMNYY